MQILNCKLKFCKLKFQITKFKFEILIQKFGICKFNL